MVSPVSSAELPPALAELAATHGIATRFYDWRGNERIVAPSTIVAVLAALDVDASTPVAVAGALHAARTARWRRVLPPSLVVREGERRWFPAHVEHGRPVEVWVELESGGRRETERQDRYVEPTTIDGVLVGEATFALPDDLPLGWHRLRASSGGRDVPAEAALVVTPSRLQLPAFLRDARGWGFMTQLYALRSSRSWGLGDLADLSELAAWSAREHDASFVLVNPLHAAEPIPPMESSPYLPASRRFVNPVYLRVEDVRELAYLPAAERALLDRQSDPLRALNDVDAELDRDAVWAAKAAALRTIHAVPRSTARQAAYDAYLAREGDGLRDFATWCALALELGLPWQKWPAALQDPRSSDVAAARERLATEVDFHCWLQWQLDEQLAEVQSLAKRSGMPIGAVHDLAVGVHPEGADAWSLQGVLASDVTVGAPPDAFNQQGQGWSQPPWRPDHLARVGYAPYRDMLRTVLRHAGGVRVDHVMGLFRLWWVPEGNEPVAGTYVQYDHEAMVGILALEAHRAGALVIGEDLGTVEPWVRSYLQERGLLGTSVLWFERSYGGEDGDDPAQPLRPERWRELCLASVTTHDLPPTAGYLTGEHIRLRDRLGLLTRSVSEERAADAQEQAALLALLVELGLLRPGAGEQETVEALHRFLTWTPARLVGVAVPDAVGDRRPVNQPGTDEQYPNWRIPVTDGAGRAVTLEALMASPRARSLARVLAGPLGRPVDG